MEKVILAIMITMILKLELMNCSDEAETKFGCYQCNSHLDDECNYLELLSDVERKSFYKACDYVDSSGNQINGTKFCRKMDIYSKFSFV